MATVVMATVIMTAISTVVVVHRSPTQYRCRRRCRRLQRRRNSAALGAFMNGAEQDVVSADLVNVVNVVDLVDLVDDFTAVAGPRMYVRSLPQPCGRTNALR
ncbi:hypothetical protein [Streptomyces stelliscabiei]|uniref:hypothetical protein n=1 Tax=Streptomyces stelliscabiei TaxID=146820 RepID=UPI0029B0A8F8|nr:hypothetical protein [Streptomyces stelliscabiei]MDX2553922.1 hypothetical protein [Streptomyces stelliscabiei]MDX2612665.1 hypothetical protein [Streptomyces stelliscabiei]MDX2638291.1 hypothetical protein [Streptomyces stelliscabiei]MDX2663762.1 hypothetical protein [Streptomyces stelliscabiei]MDX2715451.1 hypothetical protein [Streptomyces stelliscabiei]